MYFKNIFEWYEMLICIIYLIVKVRGFLIRIYNFILKYNDKKNLIFFIKVLKLKIIVIIF